MNCLQVGLALDEAHALAVRFGSQGIGVVLRPEDRLCVLDLDGPLSVDTQSLLTSLTGYAERSPSWRGVHLWLAGRQPMNRRGRDVELLGRGFVTVTAASLPGRLRQPGELGEAWPALRAYLPERPEEERCSGMTLSLADADVLARLLVARNGSRARQLLDGNWEAGGYLSRSEADLALARLLRFYTQAPVQLERLMRSSSLVRPKWGPAFQPATYLASTIQRALTLGGPVYTPRRAT